MNILIIGSGIFGVTAAIELRRRGHAVQLLDPGPLPHPLAASTDISKAVRMEYGTDEDYATLVEQSFDGWQQWNRGFGAALYHETGVLYLRQDKIMYTRVCLYCDTWDGHFWIAPDPAREGVVVATGGSGHGYKFAPVLGGLIADAVEGQRNSYSHKFRWRPEVRLARNEEEARFQADS